MWQSPGGSGKLRWPTAATCASKVWRRENPDSTAASAASSSRAARISGSSTILITCSDGRHESLRPDVSAAEYNGHFTPAIGWRGFHQASQGDAGGPFDHQVLSVQKPTHGSGYFDFTHHHLLVDHRLADWKGHRTGLNSAQGAIRKRLMLLDGNDPPRFQRAQHAQRGFGPDTDNLDTR